VAVVEQGASRLSREEIARRMLNKVPEVTIFFWIIKILATTVGETAADFLSENLNLGLTVTTYIMTAALLITLYYQFKAKRYVPGIYWLAVVLISIVGTLITDNLVDNFGVPLEVTTTVFAIALIVTFGVWYKNEGTLSIHTIYSRKRETFYWFTILFTFALGTAAGDLVAEKLNLGYWKSAIMFAGMIGLVAAFHFALKTRKTAHHTWHESRAVWAFWIAYILTRPLGASIGDFMSQKRNIGGLGLGTVVTSALFLLAILGVVIYLSVTRKDQTPIEEIEAELAEEEEHRKLVEARHAAHPHHHLHHKD
jgi:uncharacterized membrane-anchored protein